MTDFKLSQKKKILKECFDDGGYCTECECKMVFPKYIDPTTTDPKYWTKKNAAQVDHIHPKAKNGKAVLWNAQVLCRACNGKKSAGTTTLGTVGYHAKDTSEGLATMINTCLECNIL